MDPNIDPEVTKQQEVMDVIANATSVLSNEAARHPTATAHHEIEDKDGDISKDSELGYEFINQDHVKDDESTDTAAEAALHVLLNAHNNSEELFEEYEDTESSSGAVTKENRTPLTASSTSTTNSSNVKLVSYDPDAKPPRLGRPRRNLTNTLDPPESSSSKNFNEAIMSKFRLDSQPVEGPGSRGGKGGRKSPRGRITSTSIRKKTQSTLNFKPKNGDGVSLGLSDQNGQDVHSEQGSKTPKSVSQSPDTTARSTPPKSPKLILKLSAKKAENNAPVKIAPAPSTTVKRTRTPMPTAGNKRAKPAKQASRTTVLNGKNKITRQLPGPLVGLDYDLYDDSLVDQYFDSKHEKIGLGYPVAKAPYASDIVFIISFLIKFKDVIPVDFIGPGTIEYGLSLPILDDTFDEAPAKYTQRKPRKDDAEYDPLFISPEMHSLFLKLLGLVLNRKKQVTSHTKAIQELKTQSVSLGLPTEWKTLKPAPESVDDEVPQSPVDPTHPDILLDKLPQNHTWLITFNPFYTTEFETKGLAGLENPIDRLVMLRTLVHWALANSDIIKKELTLNVQQQDIPGDKETYYAARSVLYGFKNAQDTKIAAEAKLAKRKSEEEVRYVDPTSDPKAHTLNLRLNEQIAGDIGFGIGRFYLCRMADEFNGGLSSIKKMNSVWNGPAGLNGPLPSNFRLYIQDVHQMLVESLSVAGVEFDENGQEVKSPYKATDEQEHWYEVASNGAELRDFTEFLAARLGITEGSKSLIPMASVIYKPVLQLYEYLSGILPLIEKQEELLETRRSTRKRPIDYSDRRAAARYNDMVDAEDYVDENGNDDENYVEMDGVEEDDDDEEYLD
ncbi:ISWI one complex protein 3 [Candida viswanathii]|uniref:ISWI one complex protein 3 n=1 Tax=Candida viswanathii TaxID=5486 RepID=A0A367YNT8_9ASCO|nr:ISWI one complex protein 3 [Candida viswanathii]